MKVLIIDLVTGRCDLTGRDNVECLRVRLDETTPEIACVPNELIKLLRLRKKQEGSVSQPEKKGGQP